MWIPESTKELIQAAENHGINETSTFDAKASEAILSSKDGDKKEMAKDIAAMSTAGGVILYGIAEDENDEPKELDPFNLNGMKEKVSNVVQTCIEPPPEVHIHVRRLEGDRSKGFILVEVPMSPEAPHMVTKKSDNRYYGRNGPRNTRLSPRQVERLFERKEVLQRSRESLLDDLEEHATIKPEDERDEHGYLRLALRPASGRSGILESVLNPGDTLSANEVLTDCIREAEERITFSWGAGTSFVTKPTWTSKLTGFTAELGSAGQSDHARRHDAWVGFDGDMYFNAGGIVNHKYSQKVFFEGKAVKLASKFLIFAGLMLEKANYHTSVDVAIRISGIKGSTSGYKDNRVSVEDKIIQSDKFENNVRITVRKLVEETKYAAHKLTERLINYSTGGDASNVIEY